MAFAALMEKATEYICSLLFRAGGGKPASERIDTCDCD